MLTCFVPRHDTLGSRMLPQPYHVNQQSGHVAREMTMLPAKLKQANYSTHQIGKSR